MASIENLLVKRMECGLALDLAALGGEQAILAEAAALATSPLFDEVLAILCQAWPQVTKQTDLENFILSGFRVSEPTALANSLDILFDCRTILERIASALSDILTARAKQRRTVLETLIAARALEGLLRLTLENLTPKYALLDVLTSIKSSESELFANHAARIISIAYDQWKENELLDALQRIVAIPEVSAEASFSLGLAMLNQAFEQVNKLAIYERLESAKKHFYDAISHSEERDDAVAYHAAIEVILGFPDPNQQTNAQRALERLQRSVSIRQFWLQDAHLPNWLIRLESSGVEWARLAAKIQEAKKNLTRPAWLNAASVLHQLFEVYQVSRAAHLNVNISGMEQILRPHIEESFLRSHAHLSVLDDWLHQNQTASEWQSTASLLRERIKILAERATSSPADHLRGGRFPLLATALGLDALAGIRDEHCELLERLLRNNELARGALSIVGERIFSRITRQLESCRHYEGDVRISFDDLILRTINFLFSRMNLGKANAAPGQMYLFPWDVSTGAPHERELQIDYWNYLISGYGHQVRMEVSDIASGRVDIVLFYDRHRFVAEITRELVDAQPHNLKRFLGQIAVYEATDVRLGLLLVLDLTDKSRGIPHAEQNVWVETHEVGSFADQRHVVVFRVLGNRINPSATSI